MYSIKQNQKENDMKTAILKFVIFLTIFSFAAFVLPHVLVRIANFIAGYVIGGF